MQRLTITVGLRHICIAGHSRLDMVIGVVGTDVVEMVGHFFSSPLL